MLRKADRFFFVIQFAAGILTAAAWGAFAERFRGQSRQFCAAAVTAVLLLFETNAVPFARFDYEAPRWFRTLAQDDAVEAVLELPPMDLDVVNARFLLSQVVHGKKMPLGYTTSMAISTIQERGFLELLNKYAHFLRPLGDKKTLMGSKKMPFPRLMHEIEIDLLIHHKTMPRSREPNPEIHERVLWAPFFLVRRALMDVRQTGRYVDQPLPKETMDLFRVYYSGAFGAPIYEDEQVLVFAVKP
jgi:hypothetical protein